MGGDKQAGRSKKNRNMEEFKSHCKPPKRVFRIVAGAKQMRKSTALQAPARARPPRIRSGELVVVISDCGLAFRKECVWPRATRGREKGGERSGPGCDLCLIAFPWRALRSARCRPDRPQGKSHPTGGRRDLGLRGTGDSGGDPLKEGREAQRRKPLPHHPFSLWVPGACDSVTPPADGRPALSSTGRGWTPGRGWA